VTDDQRRMLASEEAKALVARLRASNERAAKRGAPRMEESEYSNLQRVMTRKLRQRTS
jgi:hypothetical protein